MQEILTNRQLCEFLNVTNPFVLKCRREGMPFYRLGNRMIRYNLSEVLEWLNENHGIEGSVKNEIA